MDYYNKDGELAGNDGQANDDFVMLLDGRDVTNVRARYWGSWWQQHWGGILTMVLGAIIGVVVGAWKGGLYWLAAIGLAAFGYWVGDRCFKSWFLPKKSTSVSDLVGTRLEPAPETVRAAAKRALERSNRPTTADPADQTFIADSAGGFHEEGGFWGTSPTGAEVIGHARPGSFADPFDQARAEINVFDVATPVSLDKTIGTFHVHPSGRLEREARRSGGTVSQTTNTGASDGATTTATEHAEFDQPPSVADVRNVRERSQRGEQSGHSFVIGARSGEIYFYDGTTSETDRYLAKISASRFFRGIP